MAVEELFDSGTLVRPTEKQPNVVHLVRALATLCGVEGLNDAPPTGHLIDLIGQPEHLVFVLLDGLGMNLVRKLPPESWICRHLKLPLQATSPSTTACALTSVATAEYPGRHGVTGWFTHLPEFALTATVLPFVERFTNQPLTERGIMPEQVIPVPPFQLKSKRQSLTLLPYLITHTTYATFARGGTAAHGYASWHHAVDLIVEHVTKATGLTYTHLYLPEVDTKVHHVGVDHPDVVSLILQIDAELARLAGLLHGRARIVVTADHGLIDVPAADQAILEADDPLIGLLAVPPTGDARMPIFHVKQGRHEPFADAFTKRFAAQLALLDIETVDRMRLFAPGPLAPHARRRFGDFVAIAHRPTSLGFHPPGRPMGHKFIGLHAGLSPEEMWVPVCVG